jgi:hypothetical protein
MLQTFSDSLVLSILAALLGVIIGVFGTYYWMHNPDPQPYFDSIEDQAVIDRRRSIATKDTSGSTPANIEIRYDTVEVRDTIQISVPESLSESPLLVSDTPLRVTPHRVRLTRYNANQKRWEQQIYAVPVDRWVFRSYVSVHKQMESNKKGRYYLGLGGSIYHNPQWLHGGVTGYAEGAFHPDNQRLTVGIRYNF